MKNRDKSIPNNWGYWQIYGETIQSDNTVICDKCGDSIFGDDPAIHILCSKCWVKLGKPKPKENA